VRVE